MCKNCDQNLPFSSVISQKYSHNTLNRELLASEDIKMLFKGINDINSNNILSDDEFDLTPIVDCKYLDINTFKTIKKENNTFSIIHLNIASLKKHKEELETVLSLLDFKIDVIGISETKIKKSQVPDFDINIQGYNKPFSTPTEAEKGGVMLFIAEKHNSIPRKKLDNLVYKPYVLESIFAEIIIPGKKKHCHWLYISSSFNDN